MAIDIMPHDSLPPATWPFRLSVRIDPRLLSSIDPAMEPFEETDSISSVQRKGKKAWMTIAQGASHQLFKSQITPLHDMRFYWPRYPQDTESSDTRAVKRYKEFGMVFDSGVDGDANPRVIDLVFGLEEANKGEQSRVNELAVARTA